MKVWGSWKRVGFHMFEFLHQNDGWLFGILVYIMCQCFKKYLYFNMYIHVNHVSISGLSWKNLLQERWIAYLPAEFSQPSSVGSFFLATGYQDTRKCRISKIDSFFQIVWGNGWFHWGVFLDCRAIAANHRIRPRPPASKVLSVCNSWRLLATTPP